MGTLSRRELLLQSAALGGSTVIGRFKGHTKGNTDRPMVHVSEAVPDANTCQIPRSTLSSLGIVAGQQIRLEHEAGPAVFTAAPSGDESWAVTADGRNRMGATGNSFAVDVDTAVVDRALDEQTAAETGGFVERVVNATGESLVALAPHGGYIEYGTDEQARRVGRRLGVPAWYCAGWWPSGGAFDRWHVDSTEIHPASFADLAALSSRGFDAAVSFHGWGEDHIAVGGAASPDRKRAVRDSIESAVGDAYEVRLATDESRNGDNPANIVNWITESRSDGIQLEQPWGARREQGDVIADAVSDVLG